MVGGGRWSGSALKTARSRAARSTPPPPTRAFADVDPCCDGRAVLLASDEAHAMIRAIKAHHTTSAAPFEDDQLHHHPAPAECVRCTPIGFHRVRSHWRSNHEAPSFLCPRPTLGLGARRRIARAFACSQRRLSCVLAAVCCSASGAREPARQPYHTLLVMKVVNPQARTRALARRVGTSGRLLRAAVRACAVVSPC